MSTVEQTKKPAPVQLTDDEKIDRAVKNVVTQVTAKVKKSVIKSTKDSAEVVYCKRVGTGVEKILQSGKIPTEEDMHKAGLKLAGSDSTSASLVSMTAKLMSRAYYLSQIESQKAKLKADKALNEDQQANQLKDFITKLDAEYKGKTASTSQ